VRDAADAQTVHFALGDLRPRLPGSPLVTGMALPGHWAYYSRSPARTIMTAPLTRRALQLTAVYAVGGPVTATAVALSQGQGGWFVFTWFDMVVLAFAAYVIPLTALLWIGWIVFWLGGWKAALVRFTIFGIALPAVYHAALLVPALVERTWHAHQFALAHMEEITDEPLLSAHGHPIGVRFAYRVNFPLGLSSLGQEPPADSPAAGLYIPDQKGTLMFFATRDSTLRQVSRGGFPVGTTTVTVDTVPGFMPMAFQLPNAFPASDPGNLCFRWKSAGDRQRQLSSDTQKVLIEIGPYGRYVRRGAHGTAHSYRLADFYEGAKVEGAKECR